MEGLQATVDGITRRVPDPFAVTVIQNNVEPDWAYDLPLTGLDRFMKKIHLSYPAKAGGMELLSRVSGRHPIKPLEPITSAGDVRGTRERILDITVSEPARSYASRLATDIRAGVDLGVSPRGSIVLARVT